MKYLIDENLPYQIGKALNITYVHATRISDQATDSQLWQYAKDHELTILTKDTDFFDRLLFQGAPPNVLFDNSLYICADNYQTVHSPDQ